MMWLGLHPLQVLEPYRRLSRRRMAISRKPTNLSKAALAWSFRASNSTRAKSWRTSMSSSVVGANGRSASSNSDRTCSALGAILVRPSPQALARLIPRYTHLLTLPPNAPFRPPCPPYPLEHPRGRAKTLRRERCRTNHRRLLLGVLAQRRANASLREGSQTKVCTGRISQTHV